MIMGVGPIIGVDPAITGVVRLGDGMLMTAGMLMTVARGNVKPSRSVTDHDHGDQHACQ